MSTLNVGEELSAEEIAQQAALAASDIDLEAELDSLMAIDLDDADEIDVTEDEVISEETLEAVDSELEKEEMYAKQEDDSEPVSEADAPATTELAKPKAKKPKGKATPRATVAGGKKSEVIRDRLGEKFGSTMVLEAADSELSEEALAAQQEALMEAIDKLAVKVGEKAVNLVSAINGNAKLSTYTEIAVKFLNDSEEGITATDLFNHYKDQDANGVKGYSEGTARSQSNQVAQLLTTMKMVIADGKKLKASDDSVMLMAVNAII